MDEPFISDRTYQEVRAALAAYNQLWDLSDEAMEWRDTDDAFDAIVADWRDYAEQYIQRRAITWLEELTHFTT